MYFIIMKQGFRGALSLCCISLLLVMLFSCVDSTKIKEGAIIGRVVLDGEDYHAEIDVLVYHAESIPSELLFYKMQFPLLDCPLSDSLFFDHRINKPVMYSKTDSQGNFKINKIPVKEYIVVVKKDGWGFSYVYNVDLENIDDNSVDLGEMTLFPEIVLPQHITNTFTLETNKSYVVEHDTILFENSHLVIEGGAKLFVKPGHELISHGKISCPEDNEMAFFSYYGDEQSNTPTNGLKIMGGCTELENITFLGFHEGLNVLNSGFTLKNCVFNKCNTGVLVRRTSDIIIKNCFFKECGTVEGAACAANNIDSLACKENLFWGNLLALKHEIVVNSVIENNLFVSNPRGFVNLWNSHSVFKNNTIHTDGIGVENSGKSNLDIQRNDINASVCVKTYYSYHMHNSAEDGWTKANNNNLIASEYAVEARASYIYPLKPFPLDFSNNYWGVVSSADIDNLIIDFHDLGLHIYEGLSVVTSEIIYHPFRRSRVSDAGIDI